MSDLRGALGDLSGALQQSSAAPSPAPAAPASAASPFGDVLRDIDLAQSGKGQLPGWTLAKPGAPSPDQGFDSGILGSLAQGAKTMGQNFIDALVAGAQGTSPQVAGNYQLAPQEEQAKFAELGIPSDQQKYVALRDPGTGQMAVYLRNPQMAEGPAAPLGRMLGLGLPEAGIPAVAVPRAASASTQLLQDFQKAGVSPSIPTVGQGIGSRLTANIISKLPVVGGPVANAVGRAASDTGQAADRLAATFGRASNPEEAGTILQSGIGQAAQRFKSDAGDLYDQFRGTIDPATPVGIDNTLAALKGPLDRFPTSPGLGAQITNPRLQQWFQTLAPQTKDVPAVYSSVLDAQGNPILLQAAQKVQTGGKLSFGELSELRSTVGRMLGDPQLIDNIPRADLKSVYAGISQDLGNAAQTAGPQAGAAFNQANQFYKAGIDRMDQLEGLLNGSPEQSFAAINRAAGSGPAANAGLLRTLQQSLAPDQWGNVGAAVIRRLGQPTAGTASALHGASDFSAPSFVTNWNKLSDAAKDTLFGANQAGSTREGLESLARVADAQKQLARFSNPSGTGSHVLGGMLAEHALDFASHPVKTVLGLLGGRAASQALMSPTFARWLYQAPASIVQAPSWMVGAQRSLANLNQLSRIDPRLAPVAQSLSGTQPGQ